MPLPEELQFIENARKQQKTTSARMDGRVCIVTGATSGVGYQAAKHLAKGGAHVVMVCRNREKAESVKTELRFFEENSFINQPPKVIFFYI